MYSQLYAANNTKSNLQTIDTKSQCEINIGTNITQRHPVLKQNRQNPTNVKARSDKVKFK